MTGVIFPIGQYLAAGGRWTQAELVRYAGLAGLLEPVAYLDLAEGERRC